MFDFKIRKGIAHPRAHPWGCPGFPPVSPRDTNITLGSRTNFGKYLSTLQPSRVMQFSLRYDF